jgi:hypothetical protein
MLKVLPAFTLMDAHAQHEAHPTTFDLVPSEQVEKLKPGDFVKIGVEFKPVPGIKLDEERFWVQLTQLNVLALVGTVNNDLLFTSAHGLSCGDFIMVERRHLLNVMLLKSNHCT